MAERGSLVDAVRRSTANCDPPVDDVVAAVSGGPDSVALLRALLEVAHGRIVVAHVNHGLRGAASNSDEVFVRDLAERFAGVTGRVTFKLLRIDLTGQPVRGNLEAVARRRRYDWLTQVAEASGIAWVATGHTADDQAETVLFRLLRGTGLDGMRGIAPQRSLTREIGLVRPLLSVTRRAVLDYLAGLGQDYRTDESNADRRFTRNRIRHELLPLLTRDYNPRVREVLGRLALQAADWHDEIEAKAAELLRRAEQPRAGALVVLDAELLECSTAAQVRGLWRYLWERERWPRREMGYREWERLARLCLGGPRALDLPGGIRVRRHRRVIQAGPEPSGRDGE
jgi:tRNA(Ile)-lysidine synthase